MAQQVESKNRATSTEEARKDALKQIKDSSVRATVLSISGQANAIGQAGGGPVLGAIGNVWGIRAALAVGAVVIAPALALYGRAIAHEGREPELEELPATAP